MWLTGGRKIPELEGSLVYRVSSRIARATQRNPVSKKTNKPKILNKIAVGKMVWWLEEDWG